MPLDGLCLDFFLGFSMFLRGSEVQIIYREYIAFRGSNNYFLWSDHMPLKLKDRELVMHSHLLPLNISFTMAANKVSGYISFANWMLFLIVCVLINSWRSKQVKNIIIHWLLPYASSDICYFGTFPLRSKHRYRPFSVALIGFHCKRSYAQRACTIPCTV